MGSFPIPPDFAAHCREPTAELVRRYHVSPPTLVRWRRQLGLEARPGAPRGNRNARAEQLDPYEDQEAAAVCLTCPRPTCSGFCERIKFFLEDRYADQIVKAR